MEILKTPVNEQTIKIEIGSSFDLKNKFISGPIELDIENQSQFLDILNTVIDEGKTKIIVDMKHVNYIDSSGLWALFEAHKKAIQKKGKLVLLNPVKDVKRVLDITKISSKILICDQENDAIEKVNS